MRPLALAALAATLALPHAAAAQAPAPTPLRTGEWVEFFWFDGVGGAVEPGDFFLSVLQPVRLRVVDGYSAGHAFDLLVDGVWRLSTPSAAEDDAPDAADGDAAWADARLSRGELLLDAGAYQLTLRLREAPPAYDWGSGFVRADVAGAAAVVPEPATVSLLAGGVLALGALARRRAARGA